jgi:hypothetical protein
MTSQGVRSSRIGVSLADFSKQDWLWTWGGFCFGYRRGDSLFTHDGAEVGRFTGNEIHGADGSYLGELKNTSSGSRLVTNLYKRSHIAAAFVPTFDKSHRKQADKPGEPMYSGHEDFPSPEVAKTRTFQR